MASVWLPLDQLLHLIQLVESVPLDQHTIYSLHFLKDLTVTGMKSQMSLVQGHDGDTSADSPHDSQPATEHLFGLSFFWDLFVSQGDANAQGQPKVR